MGILVNACLRDALQLMFEPFIKEYYFIADTEVSSSKYHIGFDATD